MYSDNNAFAFVHLNFDRSIDWLIDWFIYLFIELRFRTTYKGNINVVQW